METNTFTMGVSHMYDKHFGLLDLPFTVTPDPRFFYSNSAYREAFATLRYGIEARKGFIVITGEVGTGKTTLLKLFMHNAESTIHTAFIFNPRLGFLELLRAMLNDLGIPQNANEDRLSLTEKLNAYLIEQIKSRQIVALLIDEAQDLSDEMLEELRLLSNLETDKDKLLQIVLIGQPELEGKLEKPGLRQLKQRVALRCRLEPLKAEEIHQYINFRLKKAGYKGKELFDGVAVERVAFYSKGTPRIINMICDNALLIAYAASRNNVSAEMVEEVACDLQLARAAEKTTPAAEFELSESRDEASIIKEVMPSAWVSRKPPEEFQDYSINMERPAREPRLTGRVAGVGIGMVLGFVIAVVIGTVLYSQRSSLSEIAGRSGVQPDASRETLKQSKLIPNDIKLASNDSEMPAPPVEELPDPMKDSSKTQIASGERPATENSETAESSAKAPAALNKNLPATDPKPHKIKEQPVEPQLLSLKNQAGQLGREKTPNKEQRSFSGNFEVVENSFLRAKPDSGAEIIGTLEPGTWIRVEGRNGDYFRVRSLNDASVRGYVHQEDAFFERIARRER
jgi:general secretion pathway protein A